MRLPDLNPTDSTCHQLTGAALGARHLPAPAGGDLELTVEDKWAGGPVGRMVYPMVDLTECVRVWVSIVVRYRPAGQKEGML